MKRPSDTPEAVLARKRKSLAKRGEGFKTMTVLLPTAVHDTVTELANSYSTDKRTVIAAAVIALTDRVRTKNEQP
ncbi:TPA: hypothetical protein ACNEJR_004686 [Escherichia coli]